MNRYCTVNGLIPSQLSATVLSCNNSHSSHFLSFRSYNQRHQRDCCSKNSVGGRGHQRSLAFSQNLRHREMKLLVILITMTSSLTRSLHLVNSRRIATSLLKSRGGSTGFHSNLSMMAASTATVVDVTTERLVNLRKVMKDDGMDCIIVPTEDPHMSEYTAPYYYRREFISGFTGDDLFLSDTSC